MDEDLAGYCTTITVTSEADGLATISDNDRGIPVGMHEKGIRRASKQTFKRKTTRKFFLGSKITAKK